MIINEKKTTVAYRCPICAAGVTGVVGIFALSGDYIKLKCPCGKSHMTITKMPDDKIKLTVPCTVCPSEHNFIVKKNVFFANEIIAFTCSYSGLDIVFSGTPEKVTQALEENEKIILAMLGEDTEQTLYALQKEKEHYFDQHIADMIRFILSELAQDEKIFCHCTKKGESGEYEIEETLDEVIVRCKKCGAKTSLYCQGSIQEQAFLNADSLTLE